jgi:hypothetical protein
LEIGKIVSDAAVNGDRHDDDDGTAFADEPSLRSRCSRPLCGEVGDDLKAPATDTGAQPASRASCPVTRAALGRSAVPPDVRHAGRCIYQPVIGPDGWRPT